MNVKAELRELVSGTPDSIRTTRLEEKTLPFTPGDTVMLRTQIGSEGKNIPPSTGSPAESLLVFVNAVFVDAAGNVIAAPAR